MPKNKYIAEGFSPHPNFRWESTLGFMTDDGNYALALEIADQSTVRQAIKEACND